jgi:cytochrome P450
LAVRERSRSVGAMLTEAPIRTLADLPGPRGLPGVGNALQIKADRLHLRLEDWARVHGTPFRFAIGPRTVVVFGHPDPINAMLRERPDGFRRWTEIEDVFRELGIHGVFSAEGTDWKRQRRLAVTALNTNHLRRYYEIIRACTERLHGVLATAAETHQPFDIQAAFMAYTADITAWLAFGYDLNTLERETELQQHLDRVLPLVSRRISAPFPYWRVVTPPKDRAALRSLTSLRVAVAQFIGQARGRLAAHPDEPPRNFLESMLLAEEGYSDDEVFGNVLTMLLAGEDTTAHSLAWTTWFMAKSPALQEVLYAEAREILKHATHAPDSQTADEFTHADATLREAIRLKSAAPLLFLEPLEDTIIAGLELPAGTRVIGLSRFAEADDGADDKRQLAFGAGPRFCPGRNLAFLEARSALGMLARGFEVSLPPGGPEVEERFGFTMSAHGLKVLLQQRR